MAVYWAVWTGVQKAGRMAERMAVQTAVNWEVWTAVPTVAWKASQKAVL